MEEISTPTRWVSLFLEESQRYLSAGPTGVVGRPGRGHGAPDGVEEKGEEGEREREGQRKRREVR